MPTLYEELFKPKCTNVFEWYENRVAQIYQNKYTLRVIGGKAAAAALFAGALAAGIAARQPGPAIGAGREAEKRWNTATTSHYQSRQLAILKTEFESRLDDRCREIAVAYLSEK